MAKGRGSPRKTRKPRTETIIWSDAMTEALLDAAGEPQNAIVLRGKRNSSENTSGDTKKMVFRRIAAVVLPTQYERNAAEAGKKAQSKYDLLCTTYHKKHRELRATGSGLGDESLSGDEDGQAPGLREEQLDYYIAPGGPNQDTPREAVNIWDRIVGEFKWFPAMHQILCMRPNQVPIAITTGLGPSGPRTVLHQPPSRRASPDWDDLDLPGSNPPTPGPSRPHMRPATPSALHDHDDSSSIDVFPPSSPAFTGKGKSTHPSERKPLVRIGNPVSVKSEKVTEARKTPKDGKETKETKVKEEKKTNPRPSKKMPEPQQLDTSVKDKSSGSSQGRRKRKSGDIDDFLTMQQEYFERRERRDSQQAYMDEMKLLLQTATQFGMSKEEYCVRERQIQAQYNRLPTLPDPFPVRPVAAPLRDRNVATQPPFQLPPAVVRRQPSPELIIVASSSPARLPLAPHPFGTPQAPAPVWNFDDDEDLPPLPPPVFPNGYVPLFNLGDNEFAPPYV